MAVLASAVDPRTPDYLRSRDAMLDRLAEVARAVDAALAGGGEREVTRHHARGKLLPRERVELLVDRDSPLLELSAVAAWGTQFPTGAGVVTAIGVVEGVECVLVANDATVRAGAANPYTLAKIRRAVAIALANRLPLILLLECPGPDAAAAASDVWLPGGEALRDLARLSAAGIPTVAVVLGTAAATAAQLAALSGYTVMVRHRGRVFLSGPPPVEGVAGQPVDEETLGGAALHAGHTGLADFVAEDERDGLRLARQCVRRCNWRKAGPAPRGAGHPPTYDAEDLLALGVGAGSRTPVDPREILARVLDGSDFDEFKPGYGPGLVTGWGELYGYPLGVLADAPGLLGSAELQKAAQFVQLANAARTPLLFLQHTGGYRPGAEAERHGLVKHSALLLHAVANSGVPHLTVVVGTARGAAGAALGGRAQESRFVFSWPGAQPADTDPDDPAAAHPSAEPAAHPATDPAAHPVPGPAAHPVPGPAADPAASAARTRCATLRISGQLHDDGVIDPRDTRTVLGVCLSAVHSGPVSGAENFGVFRM
ncbi:MAG TPA: carboxyl transferase domain-containing protein [Pilimelia sp.]|nr:carboxyl transferase domain-containing protein [Pilimelia sp.]